MPMRWVPAFGVACLETALDDYLQRDGYLQRECDDVLGSEGLSLSVGLRDII